MRYLLLTGVSGAGKTAATHYLEDMGAFVVDNLPPMLLTKMIESLQSTVIPNPLVAFAVDVRSGAFFDAQYICQLIGELRSLGHSVETLYLTADDRTLLARFKETRRDHPLCAQGLTLMQAINRERELLSPLREAADYVIDTTGTSTRHLQQQLHGLFFGENGENTAQAIHIEVMSFGFKRGLPAQSDLVQDVRFLPNPFYIEGLGRQTGLDEDVRHFVMDHPVTKDFMARFTDMLSFLLPHYLEEGKHRLVIAIGCTGGAHRSVAITEATGAYLRSLGYPVSVSHRDLQVEQAHWKAGTGAASGN